LSGMIFFYLPIWLNMFDLDRTCDLFACFDARGRWDSLVAKDLCESGKFEMDT
jgi:hypothetical protein